VQAVENRQFGKGVSPENRKFGEGTEYAPGYLFDEEEDVSHLVKMRQNPKRMTSPWTLTTSI
jgi:hypothetical protein